MKNLILSPIYIVLVLSLASCVTLKTRTEGASKRRVAPKESPLLQSLRMQNADLKAKNLAYEEQFRMNTGKIEELEIINSRLNDSSTKRLGEENQELQAYKESVSELLAEKKKLEAEVLLLKEENKKARNEVIAAKRTSKEHLDVGDKLFDDRKWSEAAAEYQAFREKTKNQKSDDYALATYKIGVCFQELGLKSEAKTFYKSVLRKHKGKKAAKFAQYRLENLK